MDRLRSLLSVYGPAVLVGLALLVFGVEKWPDLALPLFWDELGVYGPGILHMVDHGIGLLPEALPPDLSRGHPLLFYALFATWVKIWGFSLSTLHLLALLITLGLAGSVYRVGTNILSPTAGAVAALSFLAMPAVYAQAGLALPEMLLALEMLWGLYWFYRQRWLAYGLVAVAAVLTKESGLLLSLAALTWVGLPGQADRWRRSAIAMAPWLGFGLFLWVQKWQNGWFLFPYHTQFIGFSWEQFLEKGGMMLDFLFWFQGRWALALWLLLGATLLLMRQRRLALSGIHPWFQLSGTFLLGMMAFTLLNFYMDRYLLCLLPLLALAVGAVAKEMTRWRPRAAWLGLSVPLLSLLSWTTPDFRYGVDPNYRQLLQVQQEAAAFLEKATAPAEQVYVNFPLYFALEDPRYGFVQQPFLNPRTVSARDAVEWYAYFQPGVPWDGPSRDSLSPVEHFQAGYASCELYRP